MISTSPTLISPVVNVSTIPHRSPFRYPGGKTWLIPLIRRWLGSFSQTPDRFVEPFAGGGVVGLTVAFERLARKVNLIELDDDVSSVWETVFNGEGKELARRILKFKLNRETVTEVLSLEPKTRVEQAFRTIVKNRVQHGGIMAPGASLMKQGEKQKGLASRWYPETLSRRILDIQEVQNRVRFLKGDGLAFIEKNKTSDDCVFFVDPPYTVTGRRLYKHSELDHSRLFKILAESKCNFLMTYDKSAEIEDLAKAHRLDSAEIRMQGRLNRPKTELIIGRDLDWARTEEVASLPFP